MPKPVLDLELVRTFVAVVDTGGFQSAGLALDLAQPTVSQQLRRLERHLGARLLHRDAGRPRLTRPGERFLPSARGLLRAARRAEESLDAELPLLGASSNVGIYLLQRPLRRYRDARERGAPPPLRIGANPDVHRWLRGGEIDLAVVEWWPEEPDFEVVPWREERLVAICPPGHPWAARSSLPLEALFETALLGGEAGTGTGTLLKEALGADADRVLTARSLGSTEAVKQAVAAGLGVSLVLESAVDNERRGGSIAAVPLDPPGLAKRILLVMQADAPATSPARDLAAFLREATS